MSPHPIAPENTADDFAAFMTAFSTEVVLDDEDPGVVIDRYYVPGFVMRTDGVVLDREKLIAHIGPVRHIGASDFRYDVHDALLRDVRLARVDQLTRILPAEQERGPGVGG